MLRVTHNLEYKMHIVEYLLNTDNDANKSH